VDDDCLYPGKCNSTSLQCEVPIGTTRGTSDPDEPENPYEELANTVLTWIKENPIITAGIGAVVLAIIVYACWPKSKGGGSSSRHGGVKTVIVERPSHQRMSAQRMSANSGMVPAHSYY
jgi:hypothetical protein